MRRIKRVLITAITLCLLILMSDIPVMAAEAEKENGATRDPAPQLTQMYVYAVYSDDGGLEYINSSPSTYIVSTTNDHGGNELYVYVVEMGYAGNRTATFNGNTMTLNDMVPLDTDSNGIVDGAEPFVHVAAGAACPEFHGVDVLSARNLFSLKKEKVPRAPLKENRFAHAGLGNSISAR